MGSNLKAVRAAAQMTEMLSFGQAGEETCGPEEGIFSSVSGSRLPCLQCMENITHIFCRPSML